MSPTLRLAIKWDPRPIDIPENIEKALIIQDPLCLAAQLVGKPTPKKEVRGTYEPCTPHEFWYFFQRIIAEEINRELEEIQKKAAGFEQAYALNMQYIQMATMHMTILVIEFKNLMETQIKTVPIKDEDAADPMEW